MLILRVPNLRLVMSVLRRQATSSSVQGGPTGCCSSSLGPHILPLEGHFLIVSITLSHGGSPLAQGWPHGGAVHSLCAASWQRSFINCLNWASPRSLRAIWNCGGAPFRVGLNGVRLAHHSFTQDLCLGARGVDAPCNHLFSDLGVCRRMNMQS